MNNQIISPLTLVVPAERSYDGRAGFGFSSIQLPLLIAGRKDTDNEVRITTANLAESLEIYLRKMISSCAFEINVPYKPDPNWLKHKQLRSMLSPSSAKTIKFIDSRDTIWDACSEYLKPIRHNIGDSHHLESVIWCLYLLALSAKYKAEVALPPSHALRSIYLLSQEKKLGSEPKSRLARLKGLFNSFTQISSCPSLQPIKYNSSINICERIQEILEDAYLLEASGMRRFFGLNSNKSAISRDLRKILSLVVRKRSWAKGIFSVGSSTIYGANSIIESMDKLVDILPTLSALKEAPVITEYPINLSGNDRACIEIVRGFSANFFRIDSHSSRSGSTPAPYFFRAQ